MCALTKQTLIWAKFELLEVKLLTVFPVQTLSLRSETRGLMNCWELQKNLSEAADSPAVYFAGTN